MIKRPVLILALGAALAAAGPVLAQQDQPSDKRLQNIEKQVRELRSIVMQAKDTGQPVQVRVVGDTDPAVDTLQTRIDDLEQAARTRNDQIDTLMHDLDQAKRDAAAAQGQVRALDDRLARLEGRFKSVDDGEATAAAAAGPAADLGAPPPRAASGPPQGQGGDPSLAFKRAKQLLLDGQYGAASTAFQDFVDTYGDSPNAPEARYWLGETLYIRGLYGDAAVAYIGAIRGSPQTGWAPDAFNKLARSLVALGKPADACKTLDEFNRRYPNAPPSAKAKAQDARMAAKCAA